MSHELLQTVSTTFVGGDNQGKERRTKIEMAAICSGRQIRLVLREISRPALAVPIRRFCRFGRPVRLYKIATKPPAHRRFVPDSEKGVRDQVLFVLPSGRRVANSRRIAELGICPLQERRPRKKSEITAIQGRQFNRCRYASHHETVHPRPGGLPCVFAPSPPTFERLNRRRGQIVNELVVASVDCAELLQRAR